MKDGSVCGMHIVTQCNDVIGGWNIMPPSSDSEWLGWQCIKVMEGVTNMAVTQHQCLGRGGSMLSQWSIWHWRWRHVTLKCWCPPSRLYNLQLIDNCYCDMHQWLRLTRSVWPNRISSPLCAQRWASQKCSNHGGGGGGGSSSTQLWIITKQYIMVELLVAVYFIFC